MESMEFEIDDEDGLLSIVNTDRYSTFVDEDWIILGNCGIKRKTAIFF